MPRKLGFPKVLEMTQGRSIQRAFLLAAIGALVVLTTAVPGQEDDVAEQSKKSASFFVESPMVSELLDDAAAKTVLDKHLRAAPTIRSSSKTDPLFSDKSTGSRRTIYRMRF